MGDLKKFSAQISFTAISGYGSTVGFKGDGKTATPEDAVIATLSELAWVSASGGFGETAAVVFAQKVADATETYEMLIRTDAIASQVKP